jgi:hypothetical protein
MYLTISQQILFSLIKLVSTERLRILCLGKEALTAGFFLMRTTHVVKKTAFFLFVLGY